LDVLDGSRPFTNPGPDNRIPRLSIAASNAFTAFTVTSVGMTAGIADG
jgi:hypothetical protein